MNILMATLYDFDDEVYFSHSGVLGCVKRVEDRQEIVVCRREKNRTKEFFT